MKRESDSNRWRRVGSPSVVPHTASDPKGPAMSADLSGRHAVVTGGSQGIGLGVAEALLTAGASVTLVARDADRLRAAAAELAGGDGRVTVAPADTTSSEEVGRAIQTAADFGDGKIHILVNAAARPANDIPRTPLIDLDEEVIRREFETKPLGYFRTIRAVAPYFIAQNWGRIINIAGQSIYSTESIAATVRNAAVSALTFNVADELAPHNVTANVIHPGFTVTNRTPDALALLAERAGTTPAQVRDHLAAHTRGGRLVDVAELGQLVVFLASGQGAVLNGEVLTTGAQSGRIRTY
jgi:NAD(P)-dependent dehydrogenase (short-subunit alcohol dehydrogenase family)